MISINHNTKTIYVPKADLTLLQVSPIEIRELDINQFRLWLKDLEDDADGMTLLTTHNHYPPVSVGGVTLARVVEVINNYTVTFEDGQYAVNISGGNSNIADRININNVSVRSANSAGLVQTKEIQYASFEGGVTLDPINGSAGTVYPIGTKLSPVNNLLDAKLIADTYGFKTIYVNGSVTLDAGDYSSGFNFKGVSPTTSVVNLLNPINVSNCQFFDCYIQGILDNFNILRECIVGDVESFDGFMDRCAIVGPVTLGGAATVSLVDCFDNQPFSYGDVPIINCGGAGPELKLVRYTGEIKLQNKTGTEHFDIEMLSGKVVLDSTITNGQIEIRGIGHLENNSTGSAVVENLLTNRYNIAETTWSHSKALTVAKFIGLK